MRKTIEYCGTKPMTYRTRQLLPGDTITCSAPHARAWLATKKFRVGRPLCELPPPPDDLLAKFDHDGDGLPGGSIAPPPSDDLKELRAAYTEKLGKRPFSGWDAAELQRRMDEAE